MADGSASFADSGHTAAAANAFASAHMHTAGGDNSGIWGTVVDKLQIFANACGMSYDTDTTAGEKVGQMILAHRRTLQNRDYVILYAVAVVICFVLAGLRLRRSTNVSTQIVTLILSAMWAGQGCLMFGETCPSARALPGTAGAQQNWPIEGLFASMYFGAQSLVLVMLGNSGFLRFHRAFAHIKQSSMHQIGLFLLLLALGCVGGHIATAGAHCKLAFPLDLFTIAFLFGTAEDSGYSKQALLLPILGMIARCTGAAVHFNEMEEAPMALVGLICFYARDLWGRRSDAYAWPDRRRQEEEAGADYGDIKIGGAGGWGKNARSRFVKREPMMREVRQGEDGGVQGLSFVKELQMVDEDGDEAMEFFDVTDEGLRKRTPALQAS